jgi:hypothetical protein
MAPTGQIYTDQTGRFPVPSSNGNNYLMILYDYDSNSILAEPMRTRTGKSILLAFEKLQTRLTTAGLTPQLHHLDNECSTALKQHLRESDIDFQLVPAGVHHRNAAERCIRTFKSHFIAGLCSVDKDFPLHLWDKLVPQAEISLNLMRGSRLNPKLSAHAQMNGQFDFNRTPMAPPGLRVLVHEKPDLRTSYSPKALDGWYLGPALDAYRCYHVWIWETRASRNCDTLPWFPTKVTMPLASSTDLILAGINDIVNALNNPSPGSPLAPLSDSHVAKLQQLTTVLTNIIEPLPPANLADINPAPLPDPVEAPNCPLPAIPLRVEHMPPLRVAQTTPQSAMLTTDPTPPRRLKCTVRFGPLPPPHASNTFTNSTGPTGRKRRRTKRAIPSSMPCKTVHPTQLRRQKESTNKRKPRVTTKPPIRVTKAPRQRTHQHSYGTRSTTQPLQHVAPTTAQALLSTTDPESPAFAHVALHGNAFNPDTDKLAEFIELSKCSEGALWQHSNAEEIGRLAQEGYGNIKGTNTIFFIDPTKIPPGRKITYLRVVSAYQPEKSNPRRVRWTVGGNLIDYPGEVSTKTADLCTAKLLFNSVISTPDAQFMTGDLKDFYLGTPMDRYEYMRVPIHMIPADIIKSYNLTPLIKNGVIYVEIRRGMYGLPQAGKLANDQLVQFLAPHGYAPVPLTHGLWKHHTRDIVFTLVVDDFGVKYTKRCDAEHLINTLEKYYKVSTDWTGARYCGLTLHWNYSQQTCDVSMPGYVERALQRFQHPPNAKPEHSPHAWVKPNYGAKTQYAAAPDTTPAINVTNTKHLQEVLGTLLYYARAVDSTMLTAIGELATQQSTGTKHTMEALTQLLNYAATNPEATVRYTASDMLLAVGESDASYLSVSKARSRAAGYFFLTNQRKSNTDSYNANGAVHVLCQIMREVLSSAAEAELGALFHNGKEACPLRIALSEMGHPQPATPIATDNSTATGIANDTVKQKRSKAIDMRFYWIRDRVRQGQFQVYWGKGSHNRADYFTKHHPASHHKAIRSTYLHSPDNPTKNYFDCLDDTTHETIGLKNVARTATKATTSAQQNSGEGVLIPGEPGRDPGNPESTFHHSAISTPLII